MLMLPGGKVNCCKILRFAGLVFSKHLFALILVIRGCLLLTINSGESFRKTALVLNGVFDDIEVNDKAVRLIFSTAFRQ
jgi:hypothetical protein